MSKRTQVDFGKALKGAIFRAGYYSVMDFSRCSGICYQQLIKWLHGTREIKLSSMVMLANKLDISVADLVAFGETRESVLHVVKSEAA